MRSPCKQQLLSVLRGRDPPEQCGRFALNSSQAGKKGKKKKRACKTSPDVPSPICKCLNSASAIAVWHAGGTGRGRKPSAPPRPPGPAPLAAPVPSLGLQLAAKLRLFRVQRAAVKADGCLLCPQVLLKDGNILELIREAFVVVVFFVCHPG